MRKKNKPLVPRNGHTLVVAIVARISGCANQKEMSNDDQVDHAKEEVSSAYSGPIEYVVFATVGKGERLDRPELAEIEAALRSRRLDLLIVEDLGRLVRGSEAMWLFGIGVDNGVRCISPNDGIDTIEPTWEQDALNACAEHVGHNAHTSRRLKFKLMNRFMKNGGAPALPIYGYIVDKDAKTYNQWRKDPAATKFIRDGFHLLRQSLNCSAVADLFNENGVPVGPYARNEKWDGSMIRRFYANTLLKGVARRGIRHTVKNYEQGRRKCQKTGEAPETYDCPHLAHLEPDEFDEVNALLDTKNRNLGRKAMNGVDPLLNVPRKRTRFPGQWSRCWYCGHHHVWGGNGITKNLMCSASRRWECWNSIGFDGALAAQRVVALIMAELTAIEGIDDAFRDVIERERKQHATGKCNMEWSQLLAEEQRLAKEQKNITDGIAECGPEPMLKSRLKEIKLAQEAASLQRRKLEALTTRPLTLPSNSQELRGMIEATLGNLAIESPACSDILRKLVPGFHVYLVRACDGGHLLPRAKVQLALDGIVPDAKHAAEFSQMLRREATIDLFEPTQRVRILNDVARLHETNLSCGDIAGLIPERPTTTAVQDALNVILPTFWARG